MTVYLVLAIVMILFSAIALIVRRHPMIKLLAVNLMGIGVFLWLIANAQLNAVIDAVPHALVLTGIVVAVSATAFGLALLVSQHELEQGNDEND